MGGCGVLELREEVQLPDCLDLDAPIREAVAPYHPPPGDHRALLHCLAPLASVLHRNVPCH